MVLLSASLLGAGATAAAASPLGAGAAPARAHADLASAGAGAHVPRVVTERPRQGAADVSPGARVVVTLSAPPLPKAPMPVLSPPVAGEWGLQGRTLTFTPESGYRPWSKEHVSFPGGLATAKVLTFVVGAVPVLRFQQALAELHYLPLRFGPTPTTSALRSEAYEVSEVRTTAMPGVFEWRYPNTPRQMQALWAAGTYNVLTTGAVMRFEQHAGLPTDGLLSPQVWAKLAGALAGRHQYVGHYDYVMVHETLPESLVVWQDGKDMLRSLTNTGVVGAQTPLGTWPVYERFASTTMAGTDPNGTKYDISGVPWVAYFLGGDAVHGFWRSGYGYPQSNGCVELPVSTAQLVWGMDPIGTLVTVGY